MKEILINILLFGSLITMIIIGMTSLYVKKETEYKLGITFLISFLIFTVGIGMFGTEHPYYEGTVTLINDNDKYLKVNNKLYEVLNHSDYQLINGQKIQYDTVDASKIMIME